MVYRVVGRAGCVVGVSFNWFHVHNHARLPVVVIRWQRRQCASSRGGGV
jgi:hypothetical protein